MVLALRVAWMMGAAGLIWLGGFAVNACRRVQVRRWFACVMCVCAAALIGGCSGDEDRPRTGPLRIVVSLPPLAGLAEAMTPTAHEITMLIKPGQSCHAHEMTPADVAAIAQADVLIYVGLGLEPKIESLLARRPSPHRQVVCFANVVGATLHEQHHHHHHAPGEPCDHGPVDPHLWVDPDLVRQLIPAMGEAIRTAMKNRAEPAVIEQSLAAQADLLHRLDELDVVLRSTLAPVAGESIVTHHDAFSRMTERYGLTVAAVIRPMATEEPTPAEVAAAVRALKDHRARGVFVEPQFPAPAARRIAESAGVPLGTLDVLGDGDWFAMMHRNAEEIARVLGPTEAR